MVKFKTYIMECSSFCGTEEIIAKDMKSAVLKANEVYDHDRQPHANWCWYLKEKGNPEEWHLSRLDGKVIKHWIPKEKLKRVIN